MTPQSVEQRQFIISVRVAILCAVFCIGTVGAAAAWAQNVTNHIANVDETLTEMKLTLQKVQELSVLQERTLRLDERLQRLEDWRLEASRGAYR